MKYRPRKPSKVASSRAKPHNISVRGVPRDVPDYRALVRAVIEIAKEEVRQEREATKTEQ